MRNIDLGEMKRIFPYWTHAQYIELIRELRKKPPTDHVPFQLCPKCNGEGDVDVIISTNYKLDLSVPVITTTRANCDVCGGKKIIPMHTL